MGIFNPCATLLLYYLWEEDVYSKGDSRVRVWVSGGGGGKYDSSI